MTPNDEILEYFLEIARKRQDKLILDKNISPINEIKIAFNGYAENPLTGMFDDEGSESYITLINEDSGNKDYTFPEKINFVNYEEFTDTICIYAWYEVKSKKWFFGDNLRLPVNIPFSEKTFAKVLQALKKRYFIKKRDA